MYTKIERRILHYTIKSFLDRKIRILCQNITTETEEKYNFYRFYSGNQKKKNTRT